MNEDIKALYQSVIMAHNKAPYHYEKKEDAGLTIKAYNPLCGDKYQVYLDIEGDRIQSAYFHGYGCAVSKAATSILVQELEGKTVTEALQLCEEYLSVVMEEKETEREDFQAFAAARQFPGREQCAVLAWEFSF